MSRIRPAAGTYAPYALGYINQTPEGADPLDALAAQPTALHQLLLGLPDEQAAFCYAPGKWSIKQMLLHVTDTERIFTYRALRFARGDAQELPGFDENTYAAASAADHRSLAGLLQEFQAVRQATLALFRSFDETRLDRLGTASGHPTSVRALLYITVGHELHHARILTERYLPLLGGA